MGITVRPADDAEHAWKTARLYSITLSVPGFIDQFVYINPSTVTESSLRQIVAYFRASVREQLGLRRV